MGENPLERIEVKLYGHAEIAPGKIKIHDTTKILDALEKAAVACAKEIDPNVDENKLVLSLSSLREGSQCMGLTANDSRLLTGIEIFLKAGQEKRISSLPPVAQKQMKEINQVQKRLNCDISFYWGSLTQGEPIAVFLHTESVSLPKPIWMKNTVVRGKVIRVGGKDPSLALDLMNGEILNCHGKKELIQELAGYLYREVHVRGDALIDGITLKKKDFAIEGFELWRPMKAAESLGVLRREFGHFFDEIEDVEAHTKAKRGEEDSEDESSEQEDFSEGGIV
jgi:hypothetical protein